MPQALKTQGTGHGIYGARLARWREMDAWTKAHGFDKNSLEGQVRQMAHSAMTDKRFATTRRGLMNADPQTFVRDTPAITKNLESAAIVNYRTGGVQQAYRIDPTAEAGEVAKAAAPAIKTAAADAKPAAADARDTYMETKKREAEPWLDLLGNPRKAGVMGTTSPQKVTGDASLKIDLNGFPRGTKTQTDMSEMFREINVSRGYAAPWASGKE